MSGVGFLKQHWEIVTAVVIFVLVTLIASIVIYETRKGGKDPATAGGAIWGGMILGAVFSALFTTSIGWYKANQELGELKSGTSAMSAITSLGIQTR